MLRRTTIVVCALSLALSMGAIASATTYTFATLYYSSGDAQSFGQAVNRVAGVPAVAGSDNYFGNFN